MSMTMSSSSSTALGSVSRMGETASIAASTDVNPSTASPLAFGTGSSSSSAPSVTASVPSLPHISGARLIAPSTLVGTVGERESSQDEGSI